MRLVRDGFPRRFPIAIPPVSPFVVSGPHLPPNAINSYIWLKFGGLCDRIHKVQRVTELGEPPRHLSHFHLPSESVDPPSIRSVLARVFATIYFSILDLLRKGAIHGKA